MQRELIAGDTLNFLASAPLYPASAGWVLKYRLAPRTVGGSVISFTATAEGDDYRVNVAAATTASWGPDNYSWSSWVERGAEKYTVESLGQISVKPDPRTAAAGYDGRSVARKALDDARAALASWTPTKRRYRIADREMEFNGTADIIKAINYWELEVQKEQRIADLAAGGIDRRKVYVRLNRG